MSHAVQETAGKLTVQEYSKLTDMIGFKDELIEGDRVLSPMPKAAHTIVLDNLETLLKAQFAGMKVVREAGWHFKSAGNIDNVPGPDLIVMRPDDYHKGVHRVDISIASLYSLLRSFHCPNLDPVACKKSAFTLRRVRETLSSLTTRNAVRTSTDQMNMRLRS